MCLCVCLCACVCVRCGDYCYAGADEALLNWHGHKLERHTICRQRSVKEDLTTTRGFTFHLCYALALFNFLPIFNVYLIYQLHIIISFFSSMVY